LRQDEFSLKHAEENQDIAIRLITGILLWQITDLSAGDIIK
jgi:hypothetical protein